MITALSHTIAKKLLSMGAITQDDVTLYEYAAYSLMFSLAPIVLVIVIGGVFGMLLEGLLMIIPFVLLRKFSGGYHVKSSLVCFISSVALLSISLIGIRYEIQSETRIYYSLLVILSTAIIFALSPIDSDARKLSESERKVFRRIARLIALAVCMLYYILLYFGAIGVAIPIGAGLLITALLQLPCLYQLVRSSRRLET